MERTHFKGFGIVQLPASGRWAVATDVTEDGKSWHLCDALSYKKADFALRHAESFTRSMYKNFIDFQGNQVIFTFKNFGKLNLDNKKPVF